jgi:hypothetical protein
MVASKVTIGYALQADLLLQLYDLTDRFVLHDLERVYGQLALSHSLARLQKFLRT